MTAMYLETLLAPLHAPAVAELLAEIDLVLGPDDDLLVHLGKAVPKDSLIAFGEHGAGSLVALWRTDLGTPLAGCPVIWLDIDGEPVEAVAPDFAGLLELLPYGLDGLYDLLRQAQRLRDGADSAEERAEIAVEAAELREEMMRVAEGLDAWRAAGLPPARDPLTIVERAIALPFAAWWAGLAES